ncbi:hypothetical protein NUU61_006051 [Penicillium alfredii]|uniref:Apple domain-containing protein n=1 Tax=Penicillium alfredii TaxID=1506179 RepID=A0A9W9F095_9EURO|nr:uncharacterized protein NUU61_006051 [Penicillium alfredii]KAJ5091181.1 hypothetical protein NUU61_006051 [Penicillium alfredii]
MRFNIASHSPILWINLLNDCPPSLLAMGPLDFKPNPPAQPGLEVVVPDGLMVAGAGRQRNTRPYSAENIQGPMPPACGRSIVAPGQEKSSPKTICGIRARYFWIGVIVAMVVVAAAIAGGVGGSLATRNNNSSDSTSSPNSNQSSDKASSSLTSTSPSTTSTSTPTPTPNHVDCPASNEKRFTLHKTSYVALCDTDLCTGQACADSTIETDKFHETSLDDCVSRCLYWNKSGSRIKCSGVSWDKEAPGDSDHFHRCFLKRDTKGKTSPPDDWTVISAILDE